MHVNRRLQVCVIPLRKKKKENGDGTDFEMSASLSPDLKVGPTQADFTW